MDISEIILTEDDLKLMISLTGKATITGQDAIRVGMLQQKLAMMLKKKTPLPVIPGKETPCPTKKKGSKQTKR